MNPLCRLAGSVAVRAIGLPFAARSASDTLGVMKLHVGCAMWTYAPWQGRYLPHSLPPRDRLRAYATWCNAVEGNTTFYATPTLDTVRSWAEQTTPDFRFVLKLPKPITHERRLAAVDDPLRAFLAAIETLGRRAHALWIQLPPSFSPSDLGALTGFLRRLPHEYRYCVEVRHRAFFENPRSGQQLERALGDAGAEWVADWLREGRSPTVFIHTPDNVGALELARRFHDDVRARVPEVEPLPEPIPAGPPTLF